MMPRAYEEREEITVADENLLSALISCIVDDRIGF